MRVWRSVADGAVVSDAVAVEIGFVCSGVDCSFASSYAPWGCIGFWRGIAVYV